MAVALTIIVDPNDPASRRSLTAAAGATILKAAHAGGVDITATCGGRGRCTSCRVKFLTGAPPPPTIMDALQLGDDLVREGYRLSCQCVLHEPSSFNSRRRWRSAPSRSWALAPASTRSAASRS